MAEPSFHALEPALFDGLAARYDEQFSDRLPAHWLRASVYMRLASLLQAPSRVLEVGCGTGADAIWLAGQGHEIVATDASQAMLSEAERKIAAAGLAHRIRLACVDVDKREGLRALGLPPVDLVLANFGVLNCLRDPRGFLARAAGSLRPGGHLALTVMGRFCLWESLWYLLSGNPVILSRRWRGRAPFATGQGSRDIGYHSPGALTRLAVPGLRRVGLFGIGILLPPSYLFGLCERWPRLFASLARADRTLSRIPPLAYVADHYLILLRKDITGTAAGESS